MRGCTRWGRTAALTCRTTIPPERLAMALTSRLPEDVEVLDAAEVAADFDPIKMARRKRYRYRIWNTRRRPLRLRAQVHHGWGKLDLARLNDAAARLVGTHDVAGFAAAGHGRASTVRTIFACHAEQHPVAGLGADEGREVHVVVEGDGFLYNQVRILAGTLYEVGRGRLEPGVINRVHATGDRSLAGPTLGPQGLCLERVWYEGDAASCGAS